MVMKKLCLFWALACALAACQSDDDGPINAMEKFANLDELLANPSVKVALAKLPAGEGVAVGAYYEGDTPADIDGTWATDCCGGSRGRWPGGNDFAGTVTFEVKGPGRVDVPLYDSQLDSEDGSGSFIVGTDEHVTVFQQLAVTCKQDDEKVRVVAIDRFVAEPTLLSDYVRSYVVLARDNAQGPWRCFSDAVGTGSLSTAAAFGRKIP